MKNFFKKVAVTIQKVSVCLRSRHVRCKILGNLMGAAVAILALAAWYLELPDMLSFHIFCTVYWIIIYISLYREMRWRELILLSTFFTGVSALVYFLPLPAPYDKYRVFLVLLQGAGAAIYIIQFDLKPKEEEICLVSFIEASIFLCASAQFPNPNGELFIILVHIILVFLSTIMSTLITKALSLGKWTVLIIYIIIVAFFIQGDSAMALALLLELLWIAILKTNKNITFYLLLPFLSILNCITLFFDFDYILIISPLSGALILLFLYNKLSLIDNLVIVSIFFFKGLIISFLLFGITGAKNYCIIFGVIFFIWIFLTFIRICYQNKNKDTWHLDLNLVIEKSKAEGFSLYFISGIVFITSLHDSSDSIVWILSFSLLTQVGIIKIYKFVFDSLME